MFIISIFLLWLPPPHSHTHTLNQNYGNRNPGKFFFWGVLSLRLATLSFPFSFTSFMTFHVLVGKVLLWRFERENIQRVGKTRKLFPKFTSFFFVFFLVQTPPLSPELFQLEKNNSTNSNWEQLFFLCDFNYCFPLLSLSLDFSSSST